MHNQVLGWHLLETWSMFDELNLDREVARKWLAFVEGCYLDAPYHNALHAADVTQTVHFFLSEGGLATFLEKFEILGLLLAAMVHDLGHDGLNNLYHKNAHTDRAVAFNDQSIQENFHLHLLFTTMRQTPHIDLLCNFSHAKKLEMRSMIIDLVLHTDMSKHFANLKDFKELAATIQSDREAWRDGGNAEILMSLVLHAADISNPSKPRRLAVFWAQVCSYTYEKKRIFASGSQGARGKSVFSFGIE